MNDKPESLLIAELLEKDGLNPALTIRMDAAAELRRLHEENERLREKCDELGIDKGTWYRMAELHRTDIERLKTSVLEAVKAEREACADLCEKMQDREGPFEPMPRRRSSYARNVAVLDCAFAIRARGEI